MDWWCLTPLSRESYYAEKSTDLLQVTDKLDPLKLYRSHIAMSKNRTHNFSCGKHNGTGRCTSNCRTIASTTSPSYDRIHYVSLVRSHPLRLPRTIAATTSPSHCSNLTSNEINNIYFYTFNWLDKYILWWHLYI